MPIHIILNNYYPCTSNQPIHRFADEAMAEVEILELIQKIDEDGVANVVHMKKNFHFLPQMDTHAHVWRMCGEYPAPNGAR